LKDLFYLYCKQCELERCLDSPWACGFASLVTCFRLLGDRTTEASELVAQFKRSWGSPKNGMDTDEAISLAGQFGYRATRNPMGAARRDGTGLINWMRGKWADGVPVMLSVDSEGAGDVADHWWTVYGDPDASEAWVMDPLCPEDPFECLPHEEILKFAACNDGNDFIEYDAVAVSAPARLGLLGIPPSSALMEFLNENVEHETGWTSQGIAAALVDNHLRGIEDLESRGHASGRSNVSVSDLLAEGADVATVIEKWDVFFSEEQEAGIARLIEVLADLEAHQGHSAAAEEKDQMTMDIALNVILIATTLMDG
jgi:hypothetical protein